jgi:hypothetical protein
VEALLVRVVGIYAVGQLGLEREIGSPLVGRTIPGLSHVDIDGSPVKIPVGSPVGSPVGRTIVGMV